MLCHDVQRVTFIDEQNNLAKRLMYYSLRIILFSVFWVSLGCQNLSKPSTSHAAAIRLRIDSKTMSFRHPGTGDVFFLHLGEELYHDTGGISEVPKNISIGMRDATSSRYEPRDVNGGGFAAAESLWSHDNAERIVANTEIQYQADTGRLLITEDKSDASPCRRYILYSQHPGGGYTVAYLAPKPTKVPQHAVVEFSSFPSDINLLPGDRAEIDGKIMSIDDIPHSSHPFSIGG
ncbi:MAG: hypothetical protein V4727_12045 [Verrucomicrobiota bacterium]